MCSVFLHFFPIAFIESLARCLIFLDCCIILLSFMLFAFTSFFFFFFGSDLVSVKIVNAQFRLSLSACANRGPLACSIW